MTPLTALFAVGLALVHIFAGKLQFLRTVPRSRWLSIAGGVSVAYVFLHILPELSERQEAFQETGGSGIISYLEHHVWILALLGLAVFYGLERAAVRSRQQKRQEGKRDITTRDVFWLHMASFGAYNALIGYLLVHREEKGVLNLLYFFVAISFHFLVNDNGLREHHKEDYQRIGRWILAAAVIVGWAIGVAYELNELAITTLFAFLAGSIVLNVLKEELPEERESRFWAFALGAGVYAALLLAI